MDCVESEICAVNPGCIISFGFDRMDRIDRINSENRVLVSGILNPLPRPRNRNLAAEDAIDFHPVDPVDPGCIISFGFDRMDRIDRINSENRVLVSGILGPLLRSRKSTGLRPGPSRQSGTCLIFSLLGTCLDRSGPGRSRVDGIVEVWSPTTGHRCWFPRQLVRSGKATGMPSGGRLRKSHQTPAFENTPIARSSSRFGMLMHSA